jgi:hypothetical protein
MVFGGNVFLGIEFRFFDGFFGSYWAGTQRLDKKIGPSKKLLFGEKNKFLPDPIFLPSQ